jgi:hypothetical protein
MNPIIAIPMISTVPGGVLSFTWILDSVKASLQFAIVLR